MRVYYSKRTGGGYSVSIHLMLSGVPYSAIFYGHGSTKAEAYQDLTCNVSKAAEDLLNAKGYLQSHEPEPESQLISVDKTYKTMDGKQVKIYNTNGAGPYSVHGAVLEDGGWVSFIWTAEGKWYAENDRSTERHDAVS